MKKLLSILMLLGFAVGAIGCNKEEVVVPEEMTAVEATPAMEVAPEAVEEAAPEAN